MRVSECVCVCPSACACVQVCLFDRVHGHPLLAQIDRFDGSTPVWNDFLKDLIADARKELVSAACGRA